MRFRKHGIVWAPQNKFEWDKSHATCPTPVILNNGTLRVYVQTRDSNNVGRVAFVDLDPNDPRKVLQASQHPVLDVGEKGMFDDNGVFQTSIVKIPDGRLFMYYVGFECGIHTRYRLLTGLAISNDGGYTFSRLKKTPILERTEFEPLFRGGPFVVLQNSMFKMWYVAGNRWEVINEKSMPIYEICYLESKDGITWPNQGLIVLPITLPNEHGFGRPYINETQTGFEMYYSIRQRNPLFYCMGYAKSRNGIDWERLDKELILTTSSAPYEDQSVEFAAPITINGKVWIFYNGNDFGRDGFCLAERID